MLTHHGKPGQVLIIADPEFPVTTQMIQALRQTKQKTNAAFIGLNVDESTFLHKHYGTIAGLTSAADKIFGTVSDAGEKYFSAIETTLRKIEASYQNQYRTQGTLISQQFFIERNLLMHQSRELVNKPILNSLTRYLIKFKPYEDMRKALNLSSRSIVHEWSTVGMGSIPGYSYYVGNAAKAARFLKYGGFIGIAFSFANTTNEVVNTCTTGREEECSKSAFREYSKFGSSTFAGMAGGSLGAAAGLGLCAAIGIVTAGAGGVACAAVGSIAGGTIGSGTSDYLMDIWLK